MPGYLFRRPHTAPYSTTSQGPPPDAPDVQEPVRPACIPHRVVGPLRYAAAFVVATLAPPPLDDPPVQASVPDQAPAASRRTANLTHIQAPPPDAGTIPIPASFPDRVPQPHRVHDRTWIVTSPPDAGTPPILGSFPANVPSSRVNRYTQSAGPPLEADTPPIQASYPDSAPAARRINAGTFVTSPVDQGISLEPPPIVPEIPDAVPRRPTIQGWTNASPLDAGTPPIITSYPDSAPAARRINAGIFTSSPVDEGVILTPPPIVPEVPDIARAAPRFQGWTVGTPPDAGTTPIPASFPDRVPPRPTVQGWVSAKPLDDLTIPVSPRFPDSAPGYRRANLGWIETSPVDQGISLEPPPISPGFPDRVPPRPTVQGWAVASPRDAGTPPIVPAYPDVVRGSLRLNAGVVVMGPVDFGQIFDPPPIATTFSTIARGLRPTWYHSQSSPLDLGLQPPTLATWPDFARAAPRYQGWTWLPPRDAGIASGPCRVRLDWSYHSTDRLHLPAGFHVYKGIGGIVNYADAVATVAYRFGIQGYSAIVTGLVDGVVYTFAVRSFNSSGEEDNTYTFDIKADGTPPTSVDSLIATPTAKRGDI